MNTIINSKILQKHGYQELMPPYTYKDKKIPTVMCLLSFEVIYAHKPNFPLGNNKTKIFDENIAPLPQTK